MMTKNILTQDSQTGKSDDLKVGDWVVFIDPKRTDRLFLVFGIQDGWIDLSLDGFPGTERTESVRKATIQERLKGHRNDLGNDTHIENHVSPSCKCGGDV